MSTTSVAGVRVVRGPDWTWGDQDGGEGYAGTVVDSAKRVPPEGTVMVRWDVGKQSNYRTGSQNAYDLRIIDNAAIGVRHPQRQCHYCSTMSDEDSACKEITNFVTGMLWTCATCPDVNLCTDCYMSDKHDVSHQFLRFDNRPIDILRTMAIMVPPRKGSKKVTLRGIFSGAR
jgi:E3 ubiquitin-protein ligase mind-bomb